VGYAAATITKDKWKPGKYVSSVEVELYINARIFVVD